MSKVFFSVTMSLDGFIAPASRFDDVGDERWSRQWGELQSYVFHQQFARDNLKLGPGGETGEDNQILEQTFARTGATILGKRMFDAGERGRPGLVDEFQVALAPVLLGGGTRLFDGIDADRVALELGRAVPSPRVTHLVYTVRRT